MATGVATGGSARCPNAASHDGIPMLNGQQDASARADHEDERQRAPCRPASGRLRWSDVPPLRGLVARSVALTLAGLVTAAGCSSGGDSDPIADTTRSSSTPTSAAAPSINRGPLAEPVRNDAPKHALEDRLIAVQPLPGDPDWLAVAAGQLWVKGDDGHVSQVDVQTARPVDEWATGYSGVPACQGLAYDGTHLWACAGENRLARHNAMPGGASDQFRVSRLGDQTRFVPSNDLLWVINAKATGLTGISRDTGKAESSIDLGIFCVDLARPLGPDTGTVYADLPD